MPRHNAKRKLRQALLDLLVEHPLDKVDVQDIAAQAEVSRQTFYYNFANNLMACTTNSSMAQMDSMDFDFS